MSLKNFFGSERSGFTVGGVNLQRPPESDEEVTDLAVKIAKELAAKLPTEQDIYWFLIEQYDRLVGYSDRVEPLRASFPIRLYAIEYEGRRSENSYVGKPNPGMIYLDTEVTPVVEAHFGKSTAELIRTAIFGTFCDGCRDIIKNLRLKYAVHYHNNCVSSSSFRFADKWNEVISDASLR
jgi:hypothetical protein